MRYLFFIFCIAAVTLLVSCSSPPQQLERKSAFEPLASDEIETPEFEPPDYTKDWRSIANLGGKTEYKSYVTRILWKRLNWRMTLSGEWVDDIVEDMQRRYRWDKELADWVGEHGNPDWPK